MNGKSIEKSRAYRNLKMERYVDGKNQKAGGKIWGMKLSLRRWSESQKQNTRNKRTLERTKCLF